MSMHNTPGLIPTVLGDVDQLSCGWQKTALLLTFVIVKLLGEEKDVIAAVICFQKREHSLIH